MNGFYDVHLVSHGLADEASQSLIIIPDSGIQSGVTDVRQATQADGPEHLLAGKIIVYRILPGAMENVRVSRIVISCAARPPRHIDSQGNGVMLRDDQSAFGG